MEIDSMLEGILFASGDPMPVSRICALLGATQEEVLTAAGRLADMYSFEVRGIRLIKLEDSLQLVSAPELSDIIRRALETRKAPKLSQAALEVLAITAYYQPVTRVYIEKVRGVDSSYTVGMLTERGLIEECGRLDVPGRPALFKTTDAFLRSFGISSIDDLPPLIIGETDDAQVNLEKAIESLKPAED